MARVGYLVPEFPGQTHAFFWREIGRLEEQGVEVILLSTRRPPPGLVCHDWTAEAQARTHYLAPPTLIELGQALSLLLSRFPSALRCLRVAPNASVRERGRLLALLAPAAALVRLARQLEFDHVHVHSAANAAQVALMAKWLGGPTYSLTLHGPLKDYGPNQAEKWLHASFGIVITERLRQELQAELGDSLPAILETAPMGVAVNRYHRSSPYEPWATGPIRLFSCGRLNPVKGHQDLAVAVLRLRERGFDVTCRIAGEDDRGGGGYRKTLEATLAELGLTQHVQLLGAISETRVREELERAHIFTLASHHEPLGVAIMEAMAMGVPVVATSAGGVSELINDERYGLLVAPKDPVELSLAVEKIAKDSSLARSLSEQGRQRVASDFDSGRSARVIAAHCQPG